MTILCKHLYTYHIEVWIAECERLNLTIKAKDALEAIAKFQGSQPGPQDQQRPQFTPECFVNTLAEFIVATDQVYFHFYFYFISVLLIIFVYSLLVLWSLRSSGTFFFCLEQIFKRKTFLIAPQCEHVF